MKKLLRKIIRRVGFDVVRYRPGACARRFPSDVEAPDRRILERVSEFTMTSVERQLALIQAVRHIVRCRLPGCFVECGVWKGGSSMAAALTLLDEREPARDLYLYDTFEGMTAPTDDDRTQDGTLARTRLERVGKATGAWCDCAFDQVKANMASTGYPEDRIHLVKGKVEETIPAQSPPGPIALLRLDTDWYESTRHELHHLFPLLQKRGILIIDDYGHWQGARKATAEFFATEPKPYFLHRIDYTGRLVIKQ